VEDSLLEEKRMNKVYKTVRSIYELADTLSDDTISKKQAKRIKKLRAKVAQHLGIYPDDDEKDRFWVWNKEQDEVRKQIVLVAAAKKILSMSSKKKIKKIKKKLEAGKDRVLSRYDHFVGSAYLGGWLGYAEEGFLVHSLDLLIEGKEPEIGGWIGTGS